DVHPHHEDLAVGEVHDAENAEDEGEADADQRVDAAQHQAREGQLDEDHARPGDPLTLPSPPRRGRGCMDLPLPREGEGRGEGANATGKRALTTCGRSTSAAAPGWACSWPGSPARPRA